MGSINAIYTLQHEFHALSSTALYEAEFEDILVSEATRLFPGSWFVPFHVAVSTPSGHRKADFALIDHKYRFWSVVEVELAHHSLSQHVLPQVLDLLEAEFADEHAAYLVANESELDAASVRDMMLGAPPSVLVVVNEERDGWREGLTGAGANLAIVRVYRSSQNKRALLARLEQADLAADLLSRCSRDPLLPALWRVEAPGALPAGPHSEITIYMGGAASDWKRIESADTVWIAPLKGDPFGAVDSFDLRRGPDGHLLAAVQNDGGTDGK